MANYTDAQLAQRVNDVIITNHLGEIDAADLRQLLLDFVDSKLNSTAGIGKPQELTIYADDLDENNTVSILHSLDTDFPAVYIKSPLADGDIWSAIHFSFGATDSSHVWITFEEDLAPGSYVKAIIVKFA